MAQDQSTITVFDQVSNLEGTIHVQTNMVHFLAFHHNGKNCLVTKGLNGGSAVALISQHGAILAHIDPRPNLDMSNPHAGDENMQAKMNEVVHLYHNYSNIFKPSLTNNITPSASPSTGTGTGMGAGNGSPHVNGTNGGTSVWVVYAVLRGWTALPDQKDIIDRTLRSLGLVYEDCPYIVVEGQPRRPGHGTIVIDARHGPPEVYIDDQRVN